MNFFYKKLLFLLTTFLSFNIFAQEGFSPALDIVIKSESDKVHVDKVKALMDKLIAVKLSQNVYAGKLGLKDEKKSVINILEKKSVSIFNNIISLMYKCDKYIEFWQYRKQNLSFYLISNGKFTNILKARRDLLAEIEKKIEFFENKKIQYAIFVGNLYKIAEPFIEGVTVDVKENEINNFAKDFSKKIELVLPKDYSDSYFQDERKDLKSIMPDTKKQDMRKKYYLAGAGTIVVAVLLLRYRKVLSNFVSNFFSNQIIKPIRSLRDWFLADNNSNAFLSMSPEQMLIDLEAQKSVLKGKVADLAKELDPKINKVTLDSIMEQAKSAGVEEIVAKCIKKGRGAASSVVKSKTKPGWIEWLFFGNKVSEILGMSAKGKLLETEIKVLLSRLLVTKLLIEGKDIVDSNKITIVLASLMPMVIAGLGVYTVASKSYELYHGIPKKRKDIDSMMLKISGIIHRNIGKSCFDAQDQGFLCYFVNRFRRSLDVVSTNIRSNISTDLSYIASSQNHMDEKMQILQSLKIMLYIK